MMHIFWQLGKFALALLAVAPAAAAAQTPPPQLVLTFDDLPAHGPWPAGESAASVSAALLKALREGGVPYATAFVNAHGVPADPALAGILKSWTAAGHGLANHGWSHRSLDALTAAGFETELTNNQPYLATGPDSRVFRFPYLDEGRDKALRDAARQVLARRSYAIAPADIDTADWAYNQAWVRCRAMADAKSAAALEAAFLTQFRASAAAARAAAAQLYGRDIPYVTVLHASAFTAHLLPRLIALSNELDFQPASLAEALADPANISSTDPRRPFESSILATRSGRPAPQPPLALDSVCAKA